MKIRILAEGSTKWQRLIKHWGLSILIDDDILFDTFGKPGYVVKQLKKFGADIGKIKHIIISHDDWDHVAGLWDILAQNRSVTVYICPHFHPEIKAKIGRYGASFVEAAGVTNLRDNIYLGGELTGKRLDSDIPEQYMAVKTGSGLAVITGCAHPGIVEITRHAKDVFNSGVDMLIGGFHLKDHAIGKIRDIISELKKLGVRRMMPFHCTGRSAQELIIKEYGDNCVIPGEGLITDL
ncbi:MAG: MBL fold metallo-hydrolase [Candidatus Omnitrophica bacterium]|nr:MBL fold metallo-hydrolase [Candidatus Omnitrophota bacterium]